MTTLDLRDVLARHDRIVIAGGPRTGKTTIARQVTDRMVLHSDDLIETFEWSELSAEIVRRCAGQTRFLVEGVRAAHALRKGLAVDLAIYLDTPRVPRTPAQEAMARGIANVFREWQALAPSVEVAWDPAIVGPQSL